MTIRRARAQDVSIIQALLQDTWKDAYGDHLSQETLDEVYKNWQSIDFLNKQVQNPEVYFPIAVENDRIVGLATTRLTENIITLFRLYVLPTSQRKGIGQLLLEDVMSHYPDARRMQLHVETFNPKGLAFYNKNGFKEIKREQEKVGNETIEQILMEKEML
ncbi:MAG: GNAT family N-acetyltransferase [Candidatus Pacebacteria bacterium]|nr:GNAT family N-acetyltransferase [Candidatus Paceibacterota bacterium]